MNMAFNAFTMWKNHHLVLPTKKLVSLSLILLNLLVPLNLLYDRFIISTTLQIQVNYSFYYFLSFVLCLRSIPNLLWWFHRCVEIIEMIWKSIENVPFAYQFIFLPFLSLCLNLISIFITCSRKRHQIRVQDIEKF